MSLKKKEKAAGTAVVKKRRNPFFHDVKVNYNLYLMILPALLIVFFFRYKAMYGLVISFKDYDMLLGINGSEWVGFRHFITFFNDPYCWRLIKNTVLLGLYNQLWGFWPPIVLAILMTELTSVKVMKSVQTISYLPHFIPIVVIIGLMVEVMGPTGVVNNFMMNLGIIDSPMLFFNEPQYFRTLYIASGIWQGVGWGSIVYMAALTGADEQLYEAAFLDGANRFQRIWHISIPAILPTVTIILIMNVSQMVNVGYEKTYLMQTPATYDTSDIISTYIYRRGIRSQDFSFGTAIGFINSLVSLLLVLTTNKIVDKLNGTALF